VVNYGKENSSGEFSFCLAHGTGLHVSLSKETYMGAHLASHIAVSHDYRNLIWNSVLGGFGADLGMGRGAVFLEKTEISTETSESRPLG
jgi:hypothetical protein